MGKISRAILLGAMLVSAATTATAQSTNEIRIVEIQGRVEISPATATAWRPAQNQEVLHPLDRLRTAADSRVALRWSNQSIVPLGASSELEILPPGATDNQAGLNLLRGVLSFFHRDQPGRIRIVTRGAVAGVEGTEFVLAVDPADRTTLSVVDGKVKFSNAHGALSLTNGEQAVVELGGPPARTASFIANNLLQWCFYYPAVIEPDELQLTADEQKNLAGSLAAYRSGDLLAALAHYPADRQNVSAGENIYHAALLLAVGEVEKAEAVLSAVTGKSDRAPRLAAALRQLIAAVKRQPAAGGAPPQLASEFLAASYFEQSRAIREVSLRNALKFARQAVTNAPKSGFAWARVAELEFSFGQKEAALAALNQSLALAPRNAQALALKGFILAAQGEPRAAREWFDRALAVDAALGNAWLGRGLARIRLGDVTGGREDLLVAAALEPQRAELRSYLGKAYAATGDDAHAGKELALAKKLDPKDPTAWLYSALLNQRNNEINDAIRDLEKSQALNDNRSVYRSQLLLDEDRAVRSANLASVYRDAGLPDLSLREAGRAVSSDYANYSAHLFLANSYEQLRDPNWSNLRYEAPATSEFWIANLLAPTSAGWQSAVLGEQSYTKLFEQNRFGVVSDTTYLSRGAWTEAGAQFGTFDNFSYSLEANYRYDPGQRPNNANEHRDLTLNLKYQLTPADSVFLTVEQVKINAGDVNQYYDQATGSTDLRVNETQSPNLFLGYHHEWSPGVQTLFFAARQVSDSGTSTANSGHWVGALSGGAFQGFYSFSDAQQTMISPEENSAELQQIWETPKHTTMFGARYSWGNIHYQNAETAGFNGADNFFPDPNNITNQDFTTEFRHLSLYGYHDWQVADSLKLSAGLSYDYLRQPAVVATTPFSGDEKTAVQFSPKAGLVWTPLSNTIFRAAYTRSLAGFGNDASVRIEPTEVAGFNQAFRSLIPDTVVGDTSGSRLDTVDVSLEQKFATGTYLAVSGEILYSQLLTEEGAYVFPDTMNYAMAGALRKSLDYRERSLTFSMDQLLGQQWTTGARYRLSQANLNINYVDVPDGLSPFQARQNLDSVLHTVNLHANWNHPSGLFSSLEANWYHQNNSGYSDQNGNPVGDYGDTFWQVNAYAGCRFWHRRAELTLGLLNLFDQNYQLQPLNLYNEMARSRTFLARLRISF